MQGFGVSAVRPSLKCHVHTIDSQERKQAAHDERRRQGLPYCETKSSEHQNLSLYVWGLFVGELDRRDNDHAFRPAAHLDEFFDGIDSLGLYGRWCGWSISN